ncbi:MAG: FKBP-type peptidyl-prolyl cis-trans isomerase [Chlamydiales bacterium]|jgi:peptidylprolyl isomerase|nr:FKBP-type peptidyl-prolyl cis-trans isomerase [Chlamydiales bacterium]
MKSKKCLLLACALFMTQAAPCQESPPGKSAVHQDEIEKLSRAFGHLIGKNLIQQDLEKNGKVKLDLAQIIKGLQEAADGKESPMTENECVEAIVAAKGLAFEQESKENLEKAEAFLKKNATDAAVVSIENGKVQYRVEKIGTGEAIQSHFSPLVHYKGQFLDGSIFRDFNEEVLSLDEIITGLRVALIGMKEGEKRTIYIHPDFAYKMHHNLPPNSLLTFEIEIIQANTSCHSLSSKEDVHLMEIAEPKTDIR